MEMHWYWWLLAALVGLVIGWLAGVPYKKDSTNKTSKLVINLILGTAGGLFGTFLFWLMGTLLLARLLGVIIMAILGSILLLWLLSRVKNAGKDEGSEEKS